jgi:hypothetical protein
MVYGIMKKVYFGRYGQQTKLCMLNPKLTRLGVRVYLEGKTNDEKTIYRNQDMSSHPRKEAQQQYEQEQPEPEQIDSNLYFQITTQRQITLILSKP